MILFSICNTSSYEYEVALKFVHMKNSKKPECFHLTSSTVDVNYNPDLRMISTLHETD